MVDYAAISIAEAAPLLMVPGRRCENGKPVPITDPEWIKVKEDSEKDGKIVEKVVSVFLKPLPFSKIK